MLKALTACYVVIVIAAVAAVIVGVSIWLRTEDPAPFAAKPPADSDLWQVDPLPPKIRLRDYEKLRDGMTHSEAAFAIGNPGKEIDRAGRRVIYAWTNLDGTGMNAAFDYGRLSRKSQLGLK